MCPENTDNVIICRRRKVHGNRMLKPVAYISFVMQIYNTFKL